MVHMSADFSKYIESYLAVKFEDIFHHFKTRNGVYYKVTKVINVICTIVAYSQVRNCKPTTFVPSKITFFSLIWEKAPFDMRSRDRLHTFCSPIHICSCHTEIPELHLADPPAYFGFFSLVTVSGLETDIVTKLTRSQWILAWKHGVQHLHVWTRSVTCSGKLPYSL